MLRRKSSRFCNRRGAITSRSASPAPSFLIPGSLPGRSKAPVLERAFERIQRDERHADLHVLAFEEAPERRFPSWSMAFVGRSAEGRDLFTWIGEATGFEAKRMEGEHVLEIISSLAVKEEALSA